jgi:hypothetical protein
MPSIACFSRHFQIADEVKLIILPKILYAEPQKHRNGGRAMGASF